MYLTVDDSYLPSFVSCTVFADSFQLTINQALIDIDDAGTYPFKITLDDD